MCSGPLVFFQRVERREKKQTRRTEQLKRLQCQQQIQSRADGTAKGVILAAKYSPRKRSDATIRGRALPIDSSGAEPNSLRLLARCHSRVMSLPNSASATRPKLSAAGTGQD